MVLIGYLFIMLGLVGAAYYGLFLLLALAGQAGTHLSKKVYTDPDSQSAIDGRLDQNKSFAVDLGIKVASGLGAAAFGWLLLWWAGGA